MELVWHKVSAVVWEITFGELKATVEARPNNERWVASLQPPAGQGELRVFRYRTNAMTWCELQLAAYEQPLKYRVVEAGR